MPLPLMPWTEPLSGEDTVPVTFVGGAAAGASAGVPLVAVLAEDFDDELPQPPTTMAAAAATPTRPVETVRVCI